MKSKKPFVSICTPTFNRRPFIHTLFQLFQNQDYPKDRMEWIIVDDGTDKIEDLVKSSGIPQIRYYALDQKVSLGRKRNITHSYCKGDIIIYMDDDDYYPPERVSHAVDTLLKHPLALCAGSSEIYTFFKGGSDQMIQFGPYGPNHATAGTFAFRRELLESTCYNENNYVGEERDFLKNYTTAFVQLNPMKTILVFSHEHNTFDKRRLLEGNLVGNQMVKVSNKTVDDFIRRPEESAIKRFFLQDLDNILHGYEAGLPKMKPDVLAQIAKIDEERKMQREEMERQEFEKPVLFVAKKEGDPPIPMNKKQVADMILEQQNALQHQHRIIENLQKGIVMCVDPYGKPVEFTVEKLLSMVQQQQKMLVEKDSIIQGLQKLLVAGRSEVPAKKSKIEPEIKVSLNF